MRIRKRLASIITVMVFLLTLLPVFSWAAPYTSAYPSENDPRGGDNWYSEIRNQGTDNVSYAFATIAAAELAIIKAGQPEVDLSESHMRFAMSTSGSNTLGFVSAQNIPLEVSSNVKYNSRAAVAAYLTRGKMGGVALEVHDPYVAGAIARTNTTTDNVIKSYRVGDVIYIPNMPNNTSNNLTDNSVRQNYIESLKGAITTYGSVAGWINSSKTTTAKVTPGSYWNGDTFIETGHLVASQIPVGNLCVVAVGWDDDYVFSEYTEANEKNEPAEKGAFIIKSSWGDEIGESGYFYLSYQDSLLLKNAFALSNVKPVYGASNPVEAIYEHDSLGVTGSEIWSGGVYMSNVFTVEQKGQKAHSVSFGVAEAGTTVDVYVLTGMDSSSSVAASLTSMDKGTALVSKTFNAEGYYTLPIPIPVSLGDKNSKVAVVVRYSNCQSIPFEAAVTGLSFSSEAGQTYQSASGSNWEDISAKGYNANIKLIVENDPDLRPTGISMNTSSIALDIDDTAKLGCEVIAPDGSDKTVVWSSSDPTIATVDSNGTIKGIAWKDGQSCVITATTKVGGYSASCTVTVNEKLVTGIKLNLTNTAEEPLKLATNATKQLNASIQPSNASQKTVVWETSNENIASVTSLGKIIGVTPSDGEIVKITAKSEANETIFAEYFVEVTRAYVSGISVSRTNVLLALGSKLPVTIKTSPATASDTTLNWELTEGEEGVIDLEQAKKGVIVGLKKGKVQYKLTPAAPNPEAVEKDKVPYRNISITVSDFADYYLNVGKSVTITSGLSAEAANNLWSVVELDDNGDPVDAPDSDDDEDDDEDDEDDDDEDDIANPDIAEYLKSSIGITVSKNKAKLTGKAVGKYLVTITDKEDPDSEQIIRLYVKEPVKKVQVKMADDVGAKPLRKKELTINQNGEALTGTQLLYNTVQLSCTLEPATATFNDPATDVIWSSSKPSVATVDDNGLVTAVGVGSASITCKSASDSAKAKFSITVKYNPSTIALNRTEKQNIEVGKRLGVKVAFEKVRYISKTVTWTSSDETVATVTKTGAVRAVGPGTATITATVAGGLSSSVEVEGCKMIKTITTSPTKLDMAPGATHTLVHTITPSDSTHTGVKYTSSKPHIATVDEATGVVTAVSPGSAVITIQAQTGKAKRKVTIKVK